MRNDDSAKQQFLCADKVSTDKTFGNRFKNITAKVIKKITKALTLIRRGGFRELRLYLSVDKKVSDVNKDSKKIAFNIVEIIITEKCTLKCQGCASLMHYYIDPHHIEIAHICRDVDLLMRNVDFIGRMSILGGEPLMLKELPVLLAHIAKYKDKYGLLVLTTNATIIPSKEVFDAMKLFNVVVGISDYKDKSKKLKELKSALISYGIPYSIATVLWNDCQRIIDGSKRSESEAKVTYYECQTLCDSVMNGKFYHCSFLAHGDRLRAFPFDPRNYVDLLDENITKEAFRLYKSKENVPPGCRYCSGRHPKLPPIPTAKQIKEPLPYKRFD